MLRYRYFNNIRALEVYSCNTSGLAWFLEVDSGVLYHVNTRHDTVYLKQSIDFPADCVTEHDRVRYVTRRAGMVPNAENMRYHQLFVLVYRDDKSMFYLDNAELQCAVKTNEGATITEAIKIDIGNDETLQDIYDRCRVYARIVAKHCNRSNIKKNLPVFYIE